MRRRNFLKISSTLTLGWTLPGMPFSLLAGQDCEHWQQSSFIRIDTKGLVTLFYAKAESGQGVNTVLPMILAEELEVDLKEVRIEPLPFGLLKKGEGDHSTGGSQSVKTSYEMLRKAGATAKEMLLRAAAQKWKVERTVLKAEKGKVINTVNGNTLSYGELVCLAATLPVPSPGEVKLKEEKDFKMIGKGNKKSNIREIVTGKAQYTMDVKLPGMLYACVLRSPVMDGKLIRFDDTATKKIPGVVKVVSYKGTTNDWNHVREGVAVIATNTWAAIKGVKMLQAEWDEGTAASGSTEKLFETALAQAKKGPDVVKRKAGTPPANGNAQTLEAWYSAPLLAHATMEPMNMTAQVKGDKAELWGGMQLPDVEPAGIDAVAKACGFKFENVKWNPMIAGGSFGRRLFADYAIEAVKIAQQTDKPVKLIWTREDDIQNCLYHPFSYHQMSARWNSNGELLSWKHHLLCTSVSSSITAGSSPEQSAGGEMGGGAADDFWYKIPYVEQQFSDLSFQLPRGWYRGVVYVTNGFAVESFVDELARKMGKDPVQFRLSLLEGREPFLFGNPQDKNTISPKRLAGVLRAAAEKIGWGKPLPKDVFQGVACLPYSDTNAYVAHAIQIRMTGTKQFKIEKAVAAVDSGKIIEPEGYYNQIEGGFAFGLSSALKSEITVERGRVQQSNFRDYEILNFEEMPPLEVVVIPSQEPPGGGGEVGVPTVAAALCNALAAAGDRPRRLPIRKEGFSWI